jgi:hypothetical protein
MYYLIETKEKCYRIVDNISDVVTKESAVYKYCITNNINMKQERSDIRISGMYCLPKNDYTYEVVYAESDGWVYKGRITHIYDLMFVHYVQTDGNKYMLNNLVKSHKTITMKKC